MTDFPLTSTPIRVPDDVLADLQRRLTLTRWPVDAGNDDSCFGVNRTYLQELGHGTDHRRRCRLW
jgi:hypothetical protein